MRRKKSVTIHSFNLSINKHSEKSSKSSYSHLEKQRQSYD